MKKIYNSRNTARVTLFIGSGLALYYWILNIDFYHFYLYFYLVGFMTLIYSFRPWAVLTRELFIIYTGPIYRRVKLKLKWQAIKELKIRTLKIKTGDGASIAPAVTKNDYYFFQVRMKEPIIERIRKIKLGNHARIKDNGMEILRSDRPEGGFETALSILKDYVDCKYDENELQNVKVINRLKMIVDGILILISPIAIINFI